MNAAAQTHLLSHKHPGRARPHRIARITLILLVLGLTWRTVRYAMGFPLWGDEAFVATNLTVRDFREMSAPLEYNQIVPLGFMWAELGISKVLGLSEYALRLLPYLCGCAALVLFWKFAAAVVDRRSAMLAVGILAASYYPVRHGTEVKPYVVDMLVSLVLMWVGWRVYQRPRSGILWVILTITGGVAVWVSYPAAFVAGAVGMLLVVSTMRERSIRPLGPLSVYVAAVCTSFVLMVVLYAGPHAAASPHHIDYWVRAFPPIGEFWRLPLWLLDTHTGNMLAYPLGGKNGGSTLTFILVIIGAVTLWRRRRRDLLLLLLGPLLPAFIAAAIKRYPYGSTARLSLYMAPGICLLAGVGLRTALARLLPPRRIPRGLRVAAIVLALIAITGAVLNVVRPYKVLSDQQNRDALRQLGSQTAPGDEWVVFNAIEPVPHATFLGDFGGEGARFRFYAHYFAPVPLHWSPPPREVRPSKSGSLWLMVYKHHRGEQREDLIAAYLKTLTERLGKPQREVFPLDTSEVESTRPAAINAYRFPCKK